MLRTEILCERLSEEPAEIARAMALDLDRLRVLTDQLAMLGEQEIPLVAARHVPSMTSAAASPPVILPD